MLTDQAAVVTGGVKGIGKTFAEEFRKARFFTGESLCLDGGMTRQMIWPNNFDLPLQGGNA